jgi:glutathione-regulated potassium-efflux system ancillary protein KefC
VFVILLAQGGEFGFVVFQAAAQAGVIDAPTSSLLVAAVAVSMLITPLALVLADRWLLPRLTRQAAPQLAELGEPQNESVIIAGFGRYGQVVGRLLMANGIRPTVLDYDSETVEGLRRFGLKVFYGDATRLDLLRMAGADKARVLVVAIDDVQQNLALVDLVREHFPHLALVARARNVQHWFQLHDRGVALIERETFDSALMSARSVLELLGFERHQARNLALRYRRHNLEQLAESAPHFKDESKLIALSKIGREQMERFMAEERERKDSRKHTGGWSPQGDRDGSA